MIALTVSAFLPVSLILLPNIVHKKLFSYFIVLTTLKPLSFIIIPYLFEPNIFVGSLSYYLSLLILYYFFIFIVYVFFLIIFKHGPNILPFIKVYNKKLAGALILMCAILFFSILVITSDGVFLIDPRQGYQHHRSGVGFVWVFYILAIGIAYYYYCISRSLTVSKFLFFIFLFYLAGSKQLVLDVFIKSYLLMLWSGKKFSKLTVVAASVGLVLLMLKLFDQFGAEASFVDRLSQYYSFMDLAKLVFDDYVSGDLEFQKGQIFLSSFWGYVPRALYPDKPFAYGSISLLEIYFPGMAATGHTPSFGMLTHVFADFGWLAPILAVLLDLDLLTKIIALVIISTNSNVPRYFRVACVCIIFIPGFGFHLPIFISLFFALIVIPKLR
jgi:hypothetical protein